MAKELVVRSKKNPSILPLVALESNIILPGLMASLHIPKGKSTQAIQNALKSKNIVGLLLPKKQLSTLAATNDENLLPTETKKYDFKDLHKIGVSVRILKKIEMPDESINLLVQGLERFSVQELIQKEPYLCGSVRYLKSQEGQDEKELEAFARSVIQQVKTLSESNPYFTEELKIAIINAPSPGNLTDMVAFALSLHGKEAQSFIETLDVRDRFIKLLSLLRKEHDLAKIQQKLNVEVDSKVNKFQREFFLKEQLKSIKKELGMEEDDKSRETKILREKIDAAELPEHALKIAEEELNRLQLIPDISPEFNLTRTYIEWIVDLPWSKTTKDKLDLSNARKILDDGHFGLEKVKDRILEFLAVRKLNPNYEGTILCFVGPPGVGKTSLGKAIAKAMGRKFFRFSLGGIRDEAEIKGHRRTYVGAMPGKILQGLKRAESNNAIIMLDEIDKVGASFQGDPASALLEVLDPEQNSSFLDHYLDISFDLSKVMFIATANSLNNIPAPLLDRMEIIELSGYTLEEKESIAKKFVIPESLEKHGLKKTDVKIPVKTLRSILEDYAREPGVRTLQQQMHKISRRVARLKAEKSKKAKTAITIQTPYIEDWLGPQRFNNDTLSKGSQSGVMTGLAWTPMGGETLQIEAIALAGKGELKLTGKMGEVMMESANIALSHVKKHLSSKANVKLISQNENNFGKKVSVEEWFKTHDIHLHIPAGAIPKDGPSAGITMASTFLSLIDKKLPKTKLAMTGELSLIGNVLPVGGIKEKILAAKRLGINHVILPKSNQKDLKEIPQSHLKGLNFSFATNISEVFTTAFRN